MLIGSLIRFIVNSEEVLVEAKRIYCREHLPLKDSLSYKYLTEEDKLKIGNHLPSSLTAIIISP